uniref:Uncharacterized protein n=1 Tax=Anguilla anguilla TaxID=7936 RepID=A0A0E9TF50_ANGAN
MPVVKSDKGRK